MNKEAVETYLAADHAADLQAAVERLAGTVQHTPLRKSPELSARNGFQVAMKLENLQDTGSFKLRGAYNKIASLPQEALDRGLITASAGNHAQGVAYAARERGAKATIVMPQITPPLKVDATKAYGAQVVLHGETFDDASAYAGQLAQDQGLTFVHPFDDYQVLCGQGTIAMEILADRPDVTDVVVPLGGGGLGAGVALAIKTFRPDVRVIGAIPEESTAWRQSLAAGHVVPAESVNTAAEGVAVKRPGDLTFALLATYLDDLVEVSESDISQTILFMLEKHKLVVEAAGAVSLAALGQLRDQSQSFAAFAGEHVVVPIVSGGNIDSVTIGAVIQRGMISRGRIMQFGVELPDVPGQLVKVATILADLRANVIELNHDQFKASGHYRNGVLLEVTVEANGPEHIAQILEGLRSQGLQVHQIY
ncbi:threonine ammonia-lyase [Bifidobacterium aemilianum]|uniref:L-threonine dehydratase catabolic TdcB n=1 Tax=Bifidobacterium aemilianum TaxID=2493120 RepID=A0A366K617_9BIFI|nr:threonine ammonia-lyase [Bifidobacterium aemilianum]RBP97186.1 threonine ammonia-lyase [Bifidobacterium aemilianum]